MSTVVLANLSGAPGTTITSLGLSLVWPSDVVLIDADRAAPQAVLAGYLRGESAQGRGLQGLLQAHRERADLADALAAQALALPEPPRRPVAGDHLRPVSRRFVPGFTHLGSIELFDLVWERLAGVLRDAPFDTIVDAGRVGHRGLPGALTSGADLVGIVCRTSLTSLAALRPSLTSLLDAAPPGRFGLVLVGPGRPYAASEVERQFGVPVLAEIAWDPATATDLAEGVPLTQNWVKRSLTRSLTAAAAALRERCDAGLAPDAGVTPEAVAS